MPVTKPVLFCFVNWTEFCKLFYGNLVTVRPSCKHSLVPRARNPFEEHDEIETSGIIFNIKNYYYCSLFRNEIACANESSINKVPHMTFQLILGLATICCVQMNIWNIIIVLFVALVLSINWLTQFTVLTISNNLLYYIAIAVSGRDEPNRTLWLAT